MRVVIQRVSESNVKVDGEIKGQISKGLLILLGIEIEDNEQDMEWLLNKIVQLRIFDDKQGLMNLSISDIQGEFLVVSQFTLHASTKKGNRPSYIRAARPEFAEPMYELFVKKLKEKSNLKVQTGIFGAMMEVSLINDGPVTIIIDTKNRE
ncbi:MAG: D-aminoacyl-tRNA deacylase [Bacteroidales bacterium]|jgi:D-tyrosyl-tRNA(Tyr) deacylase|nr:D-tyrosyl-tRNA(Tyr) deacylase [Bacteroidales bacterium]